MKATLYAVYLLLLLSVSCSDTGNDNPEQPDVNLEPPASGLTLRELADPLQFEIGTTFDGRQFEDSNWRAVLEREFNLGVINWGVYWAEIEPAPGQFDFEIPDEQVAYAQTTALRLRGHPLVFPDAFPDWLETANYSDGQLLAVLRNHVEQIMMRYRGKISQWIVVNEPYLQDYRKKDIFYDRFGYDYIEFAFQAAREADPSAILIYNDTDNHYSDSETTYLTRQIVKRLQAMNLIDGVGLQMHLDGSHPPDKPDVISTMRSYGVPVYVTEFDVDLRDVSHTQNRYQIQAQIYQDMLEACLESGVCKSFTMWDIGDKYSWLESPRDASRTSPDADPTAFDDLLRPKPAYWALISALEAYR